MRLFRDNKRVSKICFMSPLYECCSGSNCDFCAGGVSLVRIVVLGSGAMGCVYGGKLAEAGCDVTLVDIWKEHIAAINKDGLRIEGVGGERRITSVKAVSSVSDVPKADLVIVFVKATTTEEAVAGAQNLFHEKTIVLTLQNGLGNIEAIAKHVNSDQIMAGVSGHGATLLGPGNVRHAGAGYTALGELSGALTERLEQLGKLFSQSGFEPVILSENVTGLIWSKLMANIAINAVTAITGIKNGQILDFPGAYEISMGAVREAAIVAQKKGIQLNGDPIEQAMRVIKDTVENRSSMLQDVSRHKQTEIEVINKAIVREAEAVGLTAPINKVLSGLIETIQSSYPEK